MPSASSQTSRSSEDEYESGTSDEYSTSRGSGEYETSTSSGSEESSTSSSTSEERSSSDSSSEESSSSSSTSGERSSSDSSSDEFEATGQEVGRNELIRRRRDLYFARTSSPKIENDLIEDNANENGAVIAKPDDVGVAEGELDLGCLDISNIQDEYFADLEESDLGYRHCLVQAQCCITPDTSADI